MILLWLLSFLIAPFAFAEHTHEKERWGWELRKELYDINEEYSYYANKYNDGSYFPAEREQEILTHVENTYLKDKSYQTYYYEDNLLEKASSIAMAKLLFRYGGDPYDKPSSYSPLEGVVTQTFSHKITIPDLSHDEIIAIIGEELDEKPWRGHLPINNALALAKLYLSLGADVHARSDSAIGNSLILYNSFGVTHDESGQPIHDYIVPDDKHFVNDRKLLPDYDENYTYYRSPVTYWLEEFIDKGYPASMLDTHKLHYPRYMKNASVAEVTAMLNNPEAHKIPANINCPYQRKQGAGDEVAQAVSPAELCPLTPSVNMRDAMGRTPLHIAGEQGNKAVFNALIKIGADESVKDYRGNLARY